MFAHGPPTGFVTSLTEPVKQLIIRSFNKALLNETSGVDRTSRMNENDGCRKRDAGFLDSGRKLCSDISMYSAAVQRPAGGQACRTVQTHTPPTWCTAHGRFAFLHKYFLLNFEKIIQPFNNRCKV